MQLLSQIYDNDGKIRSTELVLTSNNAMKKATVHRLLVGEAKYQLMKNGAVTFTAGDGSKVVLNLFGGKHKENDMITDREILSVFGTKVITMDLLNEKILEIGEALKEDLAGDKEVPDAHLTMITKLVEKLGALRDAFLQVGTAQCLIPQ